MKKIWFVLALALGAITVISINVALAQGGAEIGNSKASSLSVRMSEKLGLDSSVVEDAMRQARSELRYEAIQNKLNAMVEKGQLTQGQASEYLSWAQSKPEGVSNIGKRFFGKNRHKMDWKGRDRFKSGFYQGAIEKKIDAMVDKGEISKEEGEAKLESLLRQKD